MKAQRPTLLTIITYAFGQYGWSLASFGVGNLLIFFYMPPDDGTVERFSPYFYQGAILGVLTIVGLIGSAGRVLDAFTDPFIASFSDKTKITPFGKRKKLMAAAALPFALSAFLMFYPIIDGSSSTNVIWLVLISIIYYVSFTAYLIPYNALIAELGHHPDDRMKISTVISFAWILGFATGFSVYFALGGLVENGATYVDAFQQIVMIFSIIAFACMLVPVLFLNENKYARQTDTAEGTTNIKTFFKLMGQNKNLRIFVLSDLTYWLAATFIQLGIGYYITLLMKKEEGEATLFFAIAMLTSLLMYIPINIMVKKMGKKRVGMIAFSFYIVVFAVTAFMDFIPVSKDIIFYILAVLAAFPMASFGIIPNAIIADLVYQHEAKTGQNLAGIYYAIRTFMMKIGITFALVIFPSLLLLGKSLDNPFGV
ncbi:MAG: MFS transporter, partial [Saprospiraceae bacterium]